MTPYRTQHCTFDVPEAWLDQSITAFRIPAPAGGTEASFVVTRDPEKRDEAFEAYVRRQETLCSRGLPGYARQRLDFMQASGRDSAWLEFTWTKDGNLLLLRQIFFDCSPLAVICTLTTTPRDLPQLEQPWRAVMRSLAFAPPVPLAPYP
jgi:hypothetical protein